MSCCLVQINRVPVNNGADNQVETGSTEGLTVERATTDFATLVKVDGAFKLMGSFALVKTRLAASAKRRIGISLDHEAGSLNPADFTERAGDLTRPS
jgi:hypothetical protein